MVVDCLKSAGLKELQISVGQLDYFKSILKDVIIDEESEGKLKDFIANRNIFGVESILDQLEIHGKVRNALMALPELYGSVDILEKAMEYATNEEARAAIVRLKEIYRILEYYDVAQYVSFAAVIHTGAEMLW